MADVLLNVLRASWRATIKIILKAQKNWSVPRRRAGYDAKKSPVPVRAGLDRMEESCRRVDACRPGPITTTSSILTASRRGPSSSVCGEPLLLSCVMHFCCDRWVFYGDCHCHCVMPTSDAAFCFCYCCESCACTLRLSDCCYVTVKTQRGGRPRMGRMNRRAHEKQCNDNEGAAIGRNEGK